MRERDDRRQQKGARPEDIFLGGSSWLPSSPPPCAREVDALDDQRQLRRLDGQRSHAAVGRKRWSETPALQPLRPHRESVSIPIHDADPIAALGEEDEQVPAQGILPEHVAHDHHQAIGALAPVDRLRGDEQPDAGRQAQHAAAPSPRIATSRRTVSASNPAGTRSTCPERSTTSIIAPELDRAISMNLGSAATPICDLQRYKRWRSRPSRSANSRSARPDASSPARTARASSGVHRRFDEGRSVFRWRAGARGMGNLRSPLLPPRPFRTHHAARGRLTAIRRRWKERSKPPRRISTTLASTPETTRNERTTRKKWWRTRATTARPSCSRWHRSGCVAISPSPDEAGSNGKTRLPSARRSMRIDDGRTVREVDA